MGEVIRLNQLPEGSGNLTNDDILVFMDDPSGNKITKKISLNELKSFLGSSGGGGDVASVNGYTGVVILSKIDLGLGSVDNTSDTDKPISNATQNALDLKAPINNPTFTGSVGGLDKTMVGLNNVDNTSDANKPVSSATQTQLNLKAPLNSPTFTGTVNGISKGMVGLGNVDNTSDINKPISNSTQNALDNKSALGHTHHIEEIDNLQNSLDSKQNAGSYAPLVDGKVPSLYLPSYVDEILEYANFASFPNPGSSSKIYVDLSDNKIYRWGETSYININSSLGTTDSVPEGSVNLYFTNERASAASPVQSVSGKTGAVVLDKDDVGLSNVNNTSDSNKPISTATQNALDLKSPINNPTFTGTVNGITKDMVDLGNVDNTSDSNKPISTATQTALNNKENSINAGTTGQYYRGDKTWQTLDKSSVGLNNVDNTSDLNKPISATTQNALNLKANISDITNGIFSSGRLTISQGNPVVIFTSSTLSITGSTIYYTPYNGNLISLYDTINSKWKVYSFDELSLNIGSLSANTNFDIFLYDNNGALNLQAIAWSNNTTRATSLLLQNGIYVNSTAINKRYLGTIRTTTTGVCEDALYRQFIWNYNNKILRRSICTLIATHTYSSSTIRPFNNNTLVGNADGRIELVLGLQESTSSLSLRASLTNGNVGIGLDSTNVAAYDLKISSADGFEGGSITHAYTPIGYHYLQLVEWVNSGTGTFYKCGLVFNTLS